MYQVDIKAAKERIASVSPTDKKSEQRAKRTRSALERLEESGAARDTATLGLVSLFCDELLGRQAFDG